MAALGRKLRWEPRMRGGRDRSSALPGEECNSAYLTRRAGQIWRSANTSVLSGQICSDRANPRSGTKLSTNTAATGKDEPPEGARAKA